MKNEDDCLVKFKKPTSLASMKDTKKAISISGTHFEDVNENY